MYYILAINIGSTSTKIGLFKDKECMLRKSIAHDSSVLSSFKNIEEQYPLRVEAIKEALKEVNFSFESLSAVVTRGAATRPVESGVYAINQKMLDEMYIEGVHPTVIGLIIAYRLHEKLGIPCYIYHSPLTDELHPLARFSGLPEIARKSKMHTLNQKAVGHKMAELLGKKYEELNAVIAHLGGGISVAVHCGGKIIDVNNCLEGDGPFTPERAGALPTGQLVDMCFSGLSKEEIYKKLVGKGGLVAYLGTNSAEEVKERINNGDEEARLILEAMAYQISKEIGSMATVLKGKLDGIALTGGLAKSSLLVGWIKERVSFISPVYIFAEEDEIGELVKGALLALTGQEKVKEY